MTPLSILVLSSDFFTIRRIHLITLAPTKKKTNARITSIAKSKSNGNFPVKYFINLSISFSIIFSYFNAMNAAIPPRCPLDARCENKISGLQFVHTLVTARFSFKILDSNSTISFAFHKFN